MDNPDSAHTRGDDEAISVAKAAVLLSGGSFDADTETTCRRVLNGESEVEQELSAFRAQLRG
ncbi:MULTISPECIES: hypothetical protein [Rhodococcus]|uniref:Antitoxin VbhA domain-containing protein n=1 Tax=Rhodococcus qingshengii JCM 15477 TaxID=1303681 RepID=A0AB38R6W7_RHOSG|nr:MULTISPECIES: hypothetical protein [Rhodococcus]MCD2131394.1 hypothetical protein [Rhodococcus qingshengii]UPU40812.1 hypothetical protein M0639_17200 [Rhodococcus qingshengii JCM 15477]